jgi:hypothetical protein
VDEELGHGAGRHMRLRLQARPPQLDLIPSRLASRRAITSGRSESD